MLLVYSQQGDKLHRIHRPKIIVASSISVPVVATPLPESQSNLSTKEAPLYRKAGLIALFACIIAAGLLAAPAYAGGASCTANPTEGPPGTRFDFFCSGFSPNVHLNSYVVEPDSRAVSGPQVSGYTSNLSNGDILTDNQGNASFTWFSRGGGDHGFAHQLGTWTWVVHQLGLGNTVVTQGQANVRITSRVFVVSGATLSYSTSDGFVFNFTGSGYAPFELVNIWVTLPFSCSGRANVEGAMTDEPFVAGLFDGFFGPESVKADADGNAAFSIVFSNTACRGFYTTTARALKSGAGAEITFPLSGNGIITALGASLVATPDSVDALNPVLTLLGTGFGNAAGVNCWTTRPDGRVFPVGNATTDAGGHFALNIHASGSDSFSPFASEEPGLWVATCFAPGNGTTALTSFMLHGLTSDP